MKILIFFLYMEKQNRNKALLAIALIICSIALVFLGIECYYWSYPRIDVLKPLGIVEGEIWIVLGFVTFIAGVYKLFVGLKIIKKIKTHKIVGASMLCINAFLLYQPTSLFYGYNFPGGLYYIMLPNWVLATEFLLAIIGIVISIRLLKNKISIIKAVLLELLIIILTISVNFII